MKTTDLSTRWKDRYALRARRLQSSAIRELLKYTQKPDVISFAGGLPAAEVFPYERAREAAERVIREQGSLALQYGTTEGYTPLRELLVRHMSRYGIRVKTSNVLVTSGSQQALDLIGRLMINPGDRILVEEPSYLGALQSWGVCEAEYVTVPLDDEGIRIDRLEDAMRAGPKFMYVLPNFHNPAGVTLSLPRRRAVVEMANHYGIPIIEDDPYGQLRYSGGHLPPLVKIDADYHGCANGDSTLTGNVIYLSTFSKTLAPGLRVAWIVAPDEVIARLVQLKQGTDLCTAAFSQMVAFEVAQGGFLDRHVRTIRDLYGQRRIAMLDALDRHFPPGVKWTKPEGGLFIWVRLPDGMSAGEVLTEAVEENVAFVPGKAFFPKGGGEETFRLNFSYCAPEVIEEGVKRLGTVLKRRIPAGEGVAVG